MLWITFEDLKEDLEGSVKKVADFLKIECDAHLLATVCLCISAAGWTVLIRMRLLLMVRLLLIPIQPGY